MRYWTDFTCAATSNISSATQHCSGGAGWGVVHVKRTDEEVEWSMVFSHIFVSAPRTFGEYYTFRDKDYKSWLTSSSLGICYLSYNNSWLNYLAWFIVNWVQY